MFKSVQKCAQNSLSGLLDQVSVPHAGVIVAHAAVRQPYAEFRQLVETCTRSLTVTATDTAAAAGGARAGCPCARGTLLCRESSAATVQMSVAAVALYGVLVVLLAVDLWRGRRRLAGRLHMANRHTHALLAISVRSRHPPACWPACCCARARRRSWVPAETPRRLCGAGALSRGRCGMGPRLHEHPRRLAGAAPGGTLACCMRTR